jgi:hypothetical protein
MKKQRTQKLSVKKQTVFNLAQTHAVKGGATALCTRRFTRCDSYCEICSTINECTSGLFCPTTARA